MVDQPRLSDSQTDLVQIRSLEKLSLRYTHYVQVAAFMYAISRPYP
jgi:hypothetical protein